MAIPDFGRAAAEAGGTLITARLGPLPQGRNGGCGAPTRVAGTNGGWMLCGAPLTNLGKTEPYYCGACHEAHQRAKQMSDTPYTDLHEAHWEDFAGSNLMVVEADRCRKLERAQRALLELAETVLQLGEREVAGVPHGITPTEFAATVAPMARAAIRTAKITEALGDSQ